MRKYWKILLGTKILLIVLVILTITKCGKNDQIFFTIPSGIIDSSPEDPEGREESKPEDPQNAEQKDTGIWEMQANTECAESCSNSVSTIPVNPTDNLKLFELKARGKTENRYTGSPWVWLAFKTNHGDYRDQEIKICFQNAEKVSPLGRYLSYMNANLEAGTDLKTIVVIEGSKDCKNWEDSPSTPLALIYKNKEWTDFGRDDLSHFLCISAEEHSLTLELEKSFKEHKKEIPINSEALATIELE